MFSRTGKPDALRPLTRAGRKKMRRAARGLARLVPHLDALATSPLTRAVETGEIVARAIRPRAAGSACRRWRRGSRPGR